MSHDYGHCISCSTEMSVIDDDPNGDHNATCARCRAEEDHDFDAQPGAVFDRSGDMIACEQRPVVNHALPTTLAITLRGIQQQPQRQDGVNDQLRDLRVVANRLGLYDAADVIGKVLGESQYTCGKCRKVHGSFSSADHCCGADHVECPLSDLPRDAEVGYGLAYHYANGAFSASWEIVKNGCEGSGAAVPVYPLAPLMCKTLTLLNDNSREAGEAALKDAINHLINKRG